MKLSVIKLDGKAAGDVELSDAVFGISDIRGDLLAGLDLSDAGEDVSRALMDLARLDTQPRSQDAARHLVARMNAAGVTMQASSRASPTSPPCTARPATPAAR